MRGIADRMPADPARRTGQGTLVVPIGRAAPITQDLPTARETATDLDGFALSEQMAW